VNRPGDRPVADDCRLFRRVHPNNVRWDDNVGCQYVISAQFANPRDSLEMSVWIEDDMEDVTPAAALARYPGQFLVSLTAHAVRQEDQEISRTPQEAEPYHGDVVGTKDRPRRRKLRDAVAWVVAPDGACDTPAGSGR
jgi:hypothetical protein